MNGRMPQDRRLGPPPAAFFRGGLFFANQGPKTEAGAFLPIAALWLAPMAPGASPMGYHGRE